MTRNNKYQTKGNEMQTKITTQKFNQRDGIFENKNNIDSCVAKITTRMKIWISKIRGGKEKIARYANES